MKYDLIIIGFGKGGKTLASEIANTHKKVALIEKSSLMYGGTCINVGCIPSKSLVKSAKYAERMNHKSFEEKDAIYSNAIQERERVTSMLRKKNFDKLNNNPNITIYTGKASFVSPTAVKVILEDETLILEADKIVINTGSRPIIPEINGVFDNSLVYTSETLMEEVRLPKRLAILGGGNIGLEFASIYASFGSEVSVIQRGERLLPREDEDLAKEIQQVLEEKGIRFYTGVQTQSIDTNKKVAVINYIDNKTGKSNKLTVDGVLIATGRRPNIDELNLTAAGIKTTDRGAIKVDKYLRTNVSNIWAIGDVVGGLQFTYISLDDYRILSPQLRGEEGGYHLNARKNVPYSVFIDPPFSRVGINEEEAKAQGIEIKVAKLPVSAIPKAQVLNETKGMLKVIVHKKTNLILGAMLFCAESHEIINVVKLAMDAQLPYNFLRDQIFTHPTMTESLNDLMSLI